MDTGIIKINFEADANCMCLSFIRFLPMCGNGGKGCMCFQAEVTEVVSLLFPLPMLTTNTTPLSFFCGFLD